jgi:hypothetical protein
MVEIQYQVVWKYQKNLRNELKKLEQKLKKVKKMKKRLKSMILYFPLF